MTKLKGNTSISLIIWSKSTVDTIIISMKILLKVTSKIVPLQQLQPMISTSQQYNYNISGNNLNNCQFNHNAAPKTSSAPAASISSTSSVAPPHNKQKWVINLSNTPLSSAQTSLLARGSNFAVTPKHSPTKKHM